MDYVMTLEDCPEYAWFYTDDLNKVYFNLTNIARRTGYKVKAKLLNDFFLREIIGIKGECYPTKTRNLCDDCPVEKIINRVI